MPYAVDRFTPKAWVLSLLVLAVMLLPYFVVLSIRASPAMREAYIASGEFLRPASFSRFISSAEIAAAMAERNPDISRLGLALCDWLGFLVVLGIAAGVVATFWGTLRGPARRWPSHRLSDERLGVFTRPAVGVLIAWLLLRADAISGPETGIMISLLAFLIVAGAMLPALRVWELSVPQNQD